MDNILKYMYVLFFTKDNNKYIIMYIKYMTLRDLRSLSLGSKQKFNALNKVKAMEHALFYLSNRERMQLDAKIRWEKIKKKIGSTEKW